MSPVEYTNQLYIPACQYREQPKGNNGKGECLGHTRPNVSVPTDCHIIEISYREIPLSVPEVDEAGIFYRLTSVRLKNRLPYDISIRP